MRKTILTKVISLFLCLMCSQGAWAVVFNVTTAEEFQAALSAAAVNGADDEIVLAPGDYLGKFTFKSTEDQVLRVRPSSTEAGNAVRILDSELVLRSDRTDTRDDTGNFTFIVEDLSLNEVLIRTNPRAKDRVTLKLVRSQLKSALQSDESWYLRELVLHNTSIDLANEQFWVFESEVVDSKISSVVQIDASHKHHWTGSELSVRGGLAGVFASDNKIKITGNTYWWDNIVELLRNQFEIVASEQFIASLGGAAEGNVFLVRTPNVVFRTYGFSFSNNVFILDGSPLTGQRLGFRPWSSIGKFSSNLVYGRESPTHPIDIDIYCEGGVQTRLELINNTLPSLTIGGCDDVEVKMLNNIVWSENGGLLELSGFPYKTTLQHNIYGQKAGEWDVEPIETNLTVDPKFHDPENGDFRLSVDSPALDAGTNEAVTDPDATDLDGNPRILNGIVDIGAYERNTAPLHPADTNGDNVMSLEEFNAYNEAWRANDTWPTPPNEIPIDYVTRAGYLLQKGGEYKNIGVSKPLTWVPVSQ